MRSTARQLLAAVSLFVGSQLHAGAIDSLIVLALFAVGTALEPMRSRWLAVSATPPYGTRAALGWLAAALLGLIAAALALALYHPWGARVLAFPLEMARHTYWSRHLIEFRHAWMLPPSTLLAYWLWLAIVLGVCSTRGSTWHAGLALVALAFAAASLTYARMVYAFALVSAPLVAASVSAWLAQRRPARVQMLALLLLGLAAPAYVYRDHTPGFGLSPWVWPSSHFAFIREHTMQGQAFVSDAWAGPFLGTFYPQRRVFFDDRLEAYSEHFARDVYQRMRYGEPGWDRLLDAYQIEIVLLRYTTPGEAAFQHGAPNLRQLLAADARYSLVHFDDQGELFVRARGPNAGISEHFAITGVDPDRRQFIGRPSQAAAGLLRAAEHGNRSTTLLALTALALADRGDGEHALAAAQAAQAQTPDDPWVGSVLAAISGSTSK
jgi:hypothetical protein